MSIFQKLKFKFKQEKKDISTPEYDCKILGNNNKVIIVDNGEETEFSSSFNYPDMMKITMSGNNCTIKLHKPFKSFTDTHIEIGNDNVDIEIGENCIIENYRIRLCFGKNQKLVIGTNTTMLEGTIILDEDSCCEIGSDCLIAGNFFIFASDGHSIYDVITKELLNRVKKSVIIENHCWFGFDCKVLKHTHISKNTVISLGSVVSGDYKEENTVIAGIPAKVVKRGINWDATPPIYYNK